MHQNNARESFPPLLNIDDLARLIHRKSSTIAVDRIRRPESLPPDCTPPTQKSPVWMLSAVLDWYSNYQKPAVDPRLDKEPIEESEKRGRGRPTKAEQIESRKKKALEKTTSQSNN